MKLFRIATIALAWLASATLAHAALPPGISGSWFNPQQSGHGVTIEVLDETRVHGGWNVYDPQGNPINLYLEGVIEGQSIRSQAYVARGMRFGSFDPRDNRIQAWGTVTLAFSSCDSATLSWNADGVAGLGFGTGSMPLKRLSRIGGVGCHLSARSTALPIGTYTGSWQGTSIGTERLYAAVDSQGRFWATLGRTAGQTYFSTGWPFPVFFGYGAYEVDGRVELSVDVLYGVSFAGPQWERAGVVFQRVPFSFGPNGTVTAAGSVSLSRGPQRFDFVHDPAASDPLRQVGFDPASLEGRTFVILGEEQLFGPRRYPVRFLRAKQICVDTHVQCGLTGRIGAADPAQAMFDIEIAERGGQTFKGKAWLTGSPRKLVIVARDAHVGFSAVAAEQ